MSLNGSLTPSLEGVPVAVPRSRERLRGAF
jgi:hypothetical protein